MSQGNRKKKIKRKYFLLCSSEVDKILFCSHFREKKEVKYFITKRLNSHLTLSKLESDVNILREITELFINCNILNTSFSSNSKIFHIYII